MKTIISLIFTLAFFMISNAEAQKSKATLFFKDGTELSGLARLKGKTKVKFRISKGEKPVTYHFEELKKLQIFKEDEVETYAFIKIKEKSKPKVLKQIVSGKITLYEKVHEGFTSASGFNDPGGLNQTMARSYSISNYYVKKKNEKEAYHLGSTFVFSKNFIKASMEFFKDCPKLVAKIKNKEFKKRDIEAIVKFYNSNCQ